MNLRIAPPWPASAWAEFRFRGFSRFRLRLASVQPPKPGSSLPGRDDRPYTIQTVANFLGWTEKASGKPALRVFADFKAPALIEEGLLKYRLCDSTG
jgi:hypothetical protein